MSSKRLKRESNNFSTELTLPEYLEGSFLKARPHLSVEYQRNLRLVVSRFCRWIGSIIPCEQVTDQLIDEFVDDCGCGKGTRDRFRVNLRTIMRGYDPQKFPRPGDNQRARYSAKETSGGLIRYFEDVFLPTKLANGSLQPKSGKHCRNAVVVLMRFTGDDEVGKFLRYLVEVGGVKPVTANGYVKQLKALWTWLAKKRVVEQFPTVDKLKEPERIAIAWTREELCKFLAACGEQVGMMGGVLSNLWWVAFHRVIWDSGERTGAMLALRWDWLDLKSGHLTVPGEFRKGRQKSMVYRLKPATVEALRQIRRPDRDVIFPVSGRDPQRAFYSGYRSILRDAGLPYEPHRSGPQKWRRSFASHIEAAGGNATKALKHRDRRVTEDSYLDPRITEVEPENDKLFPLDGDEA
jgi:integrase